MEQSEACMQSAYFMNMRTQQANIPELLLSNRTHVL